MKDVAEAGLDGLFGAYVRDKRRAEEAARRFGEAVVLQPSFIYGGEEFGAAPPRVAGWYGEKAWLQGWSSITMSYAMLIIFIWPMASKLDFGR